MHRSLGASSKQLTRFFNAQKNLSFSLENNTINTYIHSNDQEPIRSKPISPSPTYSVIFPKFNKNNSPNQKNNYSMSGLSSYMSFNFSVNFLSKLTSLKNPLMLFSLVFFAIQIRATS
jgi:hypothetical protein